MLIIERKTVAFTALQAPLTEEYLASLTEDQRLIVNAKPDRLAFKDLDPEKLATLGEMIALTPKQGHDPKNDYRTSRHTNPTPISSFYLYRSLLSEKEGLDTPQQNDLQSFCLLLQMPDW